MADVSADDIHIDKFRETQQDDTFEFVKRKRCFSFIAKGLWKFVIFQSFPIIVDVV